MSSLITQKNFAEHCSPYSNKIIEVSIQQVKSKKIQTVTKVALIALGTLGFLAAVGGATIFYFNGFNSIVFIGLEGGFVFTGALFEVWTLILIASIVKAKKAALKRSNEIPEENLKKDDPYILDSIKNVDPKDLPKCLSLLPNTSENSFSIIDLLKAIAPNVNTHESKEREILLTLLQEDKFSQLSIDDIPQEILQSSLELLPPDHANLPKKFVSHCIEKLNVDNRDALIPLLIKHQKTVAALVAENHLRDSIYDTIYPQMDSEQKMNFFKIAPLEHMNALAEVLVKKENVEVEDFKAIFARIDNGKYTIAESLIQNGLFNAFSLNALKALASSLNLDIINSLLKIFNEQPELLVKWMSSLILNEEAVRYNFFDALKIYPRLLSSFPINIYQDVFTYDFMDDASQIAYLQYLTPDKLEELIDVHLDKVFNYNRDWDKKILIYKEAVFKKLNKYSTFRIEKLVEICQQFDCYFYLNTKLASQIYCYANDHFEDKPEVSKNLLAKLINHKDFSSIINNTDKGNNSKCLTYIFNDLLEFDFNGKKESLLNSFFPSLQLVALRAIYDDGGTKDEMRVRNLLPYLSNRQEIKNLLTGLEKNHPFTIIITEWCQYEFYDFEQLYYIKDATNRADLLKKRTNFLTQKYLLSIKKEPTDFQKGIISAALDEDYIFKNIDFNIFSPETIIIFLNVVNLEISTKILENLGKLNAAALIKSLDSKKGPFTLFIKHLNEILKGVKTKTDLDSLGLSKVVLAVAGHAKYKDNKISNEYTDILRVANLK